MLGGDAAMVSAVVVVEMVSGRMKVVCASPELQRETRQVDLDQVLAGAPLIVLMVLPWPVCVKIVSKVREMNDLL
jgi:hypothetical protein